MDRVIYFGYKDRMTPERVASTRKSLEKYCGVTDVRFVELSKSNLSRVLEVLEKEVQKEESQGNKCFFDLTGGEDLILVAMGILSTKYQTPMHKYNVETEELILLNSKEMPCIEDVAEKRKVKITLDNYVSIYGGVINYHFQKDYKKQLDKPEFRADAEKMWTIVKDNAERWNVMSNVLKNLKNHMVDDLTVSIAVKEFKEIIGKNNDLNFYQAQGILKRFYGAGLMSIVRIDEKNVYFRYKSPEIKECITDAGCPLELHTYYLMKDSGKYSDVRMAVHLDWDGVIFGEEPDVLNEVDVLALDGYVPVFVSCKNGKVNQMALYELHTVATRFGGKYSKMQLAMTQRLSDAYAERAEEMGIEVINM